MDKLVLITGIVFGIMIVLIISQQVHFSGYPHDNGSNQTTWRHQAPSLIGTAEIPEAATNNVACIDHETTTHLVMVKDTVAQSNGWGPKQK